MPKIFEDGNCAPAENFEALLGKSPVAVRKIADRSLGAVGKTNRGHDIVATVAPRIPELPPFNFNDRRSGQVHQQIDEVADLAQNPAATLLAVVHPMVGRKVSGVHAIVQCQRLGDRGQK